MKKGDKKKNVVDYLGKIINSLKYRERSGYGTEPESEDYEFEEPSIIPKKIFRKELYEMQVELLKLQEMVKNSGKPFVVVFEGRDSAGKGTMIRTLTQYLDPKYFKIVALGIPTPEERKDWFNRYKGQMEPNKMIFYQLATQRGLKFEEASNGVVDIGISVITGLPIGKSR